MRSRLPSYAFLTMSSALGQGFLLLISPLITRLYEPAEVGAFAVVLGLGALVGSVGTGRLEHAIPIARGPLDALRIAFLGGVLVVICSLVALAVINMLPSSILPSGTTWHDLPILAVPAIALSLAMSQLVNALLLRQRSIRSVGVNKMLQGGVAGCGQVAFGISDLGSAGMIWAQALGYFVSGLSGMRRLTSRSVMILLRRGAQIRETFRHYRHFPLKLGPAALFNLAAQQVPVLALGYIYGLYEAGLYALVMRACGAPLGMLGQAVAQVYASEFRSYLEKPGAELAREYAIMQLRLLAVGIVVVGALVLVVVLWGTWLFGERWANIGTVASLISIMLLADFTTTPVSMTLSYLGRANTQLIWDFGRLSAVLAVAAATYYFSLRFGQFLVLLAGVWSVSLFVHSVLTWQGCRRSAISREIDGVGLMKREAIG